MAFKPVDIAATLYISQKTEGIDYYTLFKILYFAEQKHLVRYGTRMVSDDFYALPHGPVPTKIYDEIKQMKSGSSRSVFNGKIELGEDYVITATADIDMDLLSETAIECLNESIEENQSLSFLQLRDKSHTSAWTNANNGKISISDIAKDGGADADMIAFIEEKH